MESLCLGRPIVSFLKDIKRNYHALECIRRMIGNINARTKAFKEGRKLIDGLGVSRIMV